MRYCFNINDKQFYFQIKYPILKKHCAVTAKQQVFIQGWRQPFHWHFLGQFLFTCWFLSDSSSNKIYNFFSVIFFVYIFTIYYETIVTTLKPEKTCICFLFFRKGCALNPCLPFLDCESKQRESRRGGTDGKIKRRRKEEEKTEWRSTSKGPL